MNFRENCSSAPTDYLKNAFYTRNAKCVSNSKRFAPMFELIRALRLIMPHDVLCVITNETIGFSRPTAQRQECGGLHRQNAQ